MTDSGKEILNLEVQIVPEDIEIIFANGSGECVLIPTAFPRSGCENLTAMKIYSNSRKKQSPL